MTANTVLATFFLTFIGTQHKTIKKEFKAFSPKHYSEDLLNDAIIKVHNKIIRSGFNEPTDKNFKGYLFLSYRNEVFMQSNKKKVDKVILPDDESVLLMQEYDQQEDILKQAELRRDKELTDEIYEYVNGKFSMRDGGLFQFYYKNKLSFSEIADLTKFSVYYVFQRVKFVRSDVIEKFSKLDRSRLTDNLTDNLF